MTHDQSFLNMIKLLTCKMKSRGYKPQNFQGSKYHKRDKEIGDLSLIVCIKKLIFSLSFPFSLLLIELRQWTCYILHNGRRQMLVLRSKLLYE
jgi:hypothetical protein